MLQLKTVLCAIDFSDLSKKELSLAQEVCEAFRAELVLHHNLSSISPGLTRAWEWQQVHHTDKETAARAEDRMRELLNEIPRSLPVQASITGGPVATVLLGLAVQLPADLLVLGSHGWSTEDHASVTERLIERCPCPVLTIQESTGWTQRFRLRADTEPRPGMLVPTDLSASAEGAVRYAFELARATRLEVHLLYVVPAGAGVMELEAAETSLRSHVPDDLIGHVNCYVRQGDPANEIVKLSEHIEPGFLVMGEHGRSFVRRWFAKDTARQVLHRAPCPVWFIPPGR